MGVLVVYTTVAKREDAERLASKLVGEKVAACVSIVGPVTSVYWWEGKRERTEEWLLVIKTVEEKYSELESVILADHPYDVPEILALPVTRGHKDYLDWVREETC